MGAVVAAALGERWVVDVTSANQNPYGINLRGPDQQHLYLEPFQSGTTRVEIDGRFPMDSHRHGTVEKHRITVALDKGPERIAAEIRSRLLPKYEKHLMVVLARNADHEAAIIKRRDLAGELGAILGVMPVEDDHASRTSINYRAGQTPEGDLGIRCEVTLNYRATEGTIKISNATPDQIRAVLAAIGLPLQRQ